MSITKKTLTAKSNSSPDTALLISMYTTMRSIRAFEEKVGNLVEKQEVLCPCHLYIGQEAVATGVCSSLNQSDYVFSNHRSHGHYIAKGGDINFLMAELFGKATGCSHGRGGSMHLVDPELGLLGSSAIVAGTIPLAVGTAISSSIQQNHRVSVSFFGDGAVCEGVFYESLNLASLRKLPIIFVCENNLYSTHLPVAQCLANTEIYRKAEAFNMPGIRIDGNNVIEVYNSAKAAIARARKGEGPTLIECLTYRWAGHVGPNTDLDKGLRNQKEWDYWVSRCPIKHMEDYLKKRQILTDSKIIQIQKAINKEVEESIDFARSSPFPGKNQLLKNIFVK
jgi:acetoin:2,6-dichlorophenolindophenol oxidoreductase subunit alpha